jgi:hypothetical protein
MQSFRGAQAGPTVCYSVTVNINPPSIGTLAGAFLDVTIPTNPGCLVGQRVFCNPATDIDDAGYLIGAPRVSATNTVRVQCVNATGGTVNPATLDYNFIFVGKKAGA